MNRSKRVVAPDEPKPQGVANESESGALARGLRMLALLNDAGRPLSLADLSELTGLASSTCHRILQTLVATGHVYRSDASRYAAGGPAVSPLALDHPLNVLRRDLAGVLQALQAQHGPSALLVAFLGTQRLVVDYVPGRATVAPYFDTHISAPLHASVSGKLLLGALDEPERVALLGDAPLARRTAHTLASRAALRRELALVASQGWAANHNENLLGISAVGVPLRAPSGRPVGALVLSGEDVHFDAVRQARMVEHLLRTADVLHRTSLSLRALARFLNV